MEKYSQPNDMQLQQLQDEEHLLMQKVSKYMSNHDKTAADMTDMQNTDTRLSQVRGRITEIIENKVKGL